MPSSQIPIFLINLNRSKDRLASFRDQMKRLELSFERVTAVDSCDVADEEAQKLTECCSQALPWDKGAMGCFLSHRKIWGIIVERGLGWAFIAEDDLHISKVEPFFTNCDWIPRDADVVKAETFRHSVSMSRGLAQKVDGHTLRELRSLHKGTGGYFMSGAAAQFFMKATEKATGPVDHVIFDPVFGNFQRMTVYQIDPAICVQDMFLKDLKKRNGFDSVLQSERINWVNLDSCPPKLKGWLKVRLEISRPFSRAGRRIRKIWKNLYATTIVKIVPYSDDSRRWR